MPETTIVAVTDLGPGNAGTVSAGDMPPRRKEELATALTYPEYRRKPTSRFRCIDGRLPADGLECEEGYADPGIAGGEGITTAAANFMIYDEAPVSAVFKQAVTDVLSRGRPVVLHGDDHKGEEGCGAAAQFASGAVFLANESNKEVVSDKSWAIAELVGLNEHINRDDIAEMIERGARKAQMSVMLDRTAKQLIEEGCELGAEYEELVGRHTEKAAEIEIGDTVLDRAAITRDYQTPNGTPVEVFVASVKAYKETVFDDFVAQGRSEKEAARQVLGAIIFNVGVSKQLTADEAGGGEAIPVVIVR